MKQVNYIRLTHNSLPPTVLYFLRERTNLSTFEINAYMYIQQLASIELQHKFMNKVLTSDCFNTAISQVFANTIARVDD